MSEEGRIPAEGEPRLYRAVPRGTGRGWGPCMVCGGDARALRHDCAFFVPSRETGEAITSLFRHGAALDYRPFEPHWCQVKLCACDEHLPNLEALIVAVRSTADRRDGPGISAEMVAQFAAPPDVLHITYTNWKGERGRRSILPGRLLWGSNRWHPEPQWLVEALDMDKCATRTFALRAMRVLDRLVYPAPARPAAPAPERELAGPGRAALTDVEHDAIREAGEPEELATDGDGEWRETVPEELRPFIGVARARWNARSDEGNKWAALDSVERDGLVREAAEHWKAQRSTGSGRRAGAD